MKHSGGVRTDKDVVSPRPRRKALKPLLYCKLPPRLSSRPSRPYLALGMCRSATAAFRLRSQQPLASARMSNASSQSSSQRPFKRVVLAFPYDSLSSRSVPHRLARIPMLHRPNSQCNASLTSLQAASPFLVLYTRRSMELISSALDGLAPSWANAIGGLDGQFLSESHSPIRPTSLPFISSPFSFDCISFPIVLTFPFTIPPALPFLSLPLLLFRAFASPRDDTDTLACRSLGLVLWCRTHRRILKSNIETQRSMLYR